MNQASARGTLHSGRAAGSFPGRSDHLSKFRLFMGRAIGLLLPGAGLRYLSNQLMLSRTVETLSGGTHGYQAAQRHGPNEGWNPTTRASEDAILAADGPMVRGRSRDLVRNNGYIAGAVRRIVNNVVHKGVRPQVKVKAADPKRARELAKIVEREWARWCKRVKFKRFQKLSVRHLVTDGEHFSLRYLRPELVKEGVVPLWIKGVESDQVDDSSNSMLTGRSTQDEILRNGIAFNEHDEPIAYYIYPHHPGDVATVAATWTQPVRVPAKHVGHFFDPQRSSQHRGVSVIAPVVMSMHDIHELTNSELIAARLMAAFGVFISAPSAGINPADFGGVDPSKESSALDDLTDFLDSGRIQILPEGSEVQQAENNRPGPQFDAINQASLRQAATGLNHDYEVFSGDYKGSSFIASRSASQETRRGYQVMIDLLVDEELDPTFDLFLLVGRMSGILPKDLPEEVGRVWMGTGWPWIDPNKDIEAKKKEIEMGVTTRSEVAASQGKDFEDVVERLREEENLLSGLGSNEKESANQGASNAQK